MAGEPLAYFLTWTTYGTWLPGDTRGWVDRDEAEIQPANPRLEASAKSRMQEPPFRLMAAERQIVEETIRAHCKIRGWELLAVSCRSNHVHVVVAANRKPDEVMNQFKSWCTRKLKEANPHSNRVHRWTRDGSTRYLNRQGEVDAAVLYVREGQDKAHLRKRK